VCIGDRMGPAHELQSIVEHAVYFYTSEGPCEVSPRGCYLNLLGSYNYYPVPLLYGNTLYPYMHVAVRSAVAQVGVLPHVYVGCTE